MENAKMARTLVNVMQEANQEVEPKVGHSCSTSAMSLLLADTHAFLIQQLAELARFGGGGTGANSGRYRGGGGRGGGGGGGNRYHPYGGGGGGRY